MPLFDKNPGVRLIGEVKEEQSAALSRSVHHKISSNSGRINNCLENCWIEFVIHSLCENFEESDFDALPLLNADNACNVLNHELAVTNFEYLCSALNLALYNYWKPSMFVDKKTAVWGRHNTRPPPRHVNVWQRSSSTNWNSRYRTNNAEMVRRWRISDRKVRGLAPRPRRHKTRRTRSLFYETLKTPPHCQISFPLQSQNNLPRDDNHFYRVTQFLGVCHWM